MCIYINAIHKTLINEIESGFKKENMQRTKSRTPK